MALNFGPVPMNFEALGSLGKTFFDAQAAAQKRGIEQQKQQLLSGLGQGSGDYQKVGLGLIGAGDVQSGVALLGLAQKDREQKLAEEAYKSSPFSSSAAPQAPTSPSSASIGNPNEVESRFIGGVKQAGLVNPVGLAAVAAYGKAESGFSPQNVNRTWNDPSESGQPGQSGGILSWRADRLQKLQSFAAQRGEQGNGSPETQATFLAQEDPTLIPRLNAARTPQEANQIMANAWRFAGYNREGGENARRLALTQQYAGRFGAGGEQPPATVPLGSAPQPVQVAENEADVRRLEAQMPGYGGQAPVGAGGVYAGVDDATLNGYLNNPRVPPNLKALVQQELASRRGGGAPVQVAQAPAQAGAPVADAPAPGAQPVQGFAVPPGEAGKLPPNDPFPQVTNEQLVQVIRNPRSSPGDKALAQQLFASRQAYASETAPEKREQTRLETRKKDLEVQKLERELKGEGARPMTPEERAAYSVPDGQPAYMNSKGEPKFGPASTKITNSIGAVEGEYAKANGKAISERFSKIVEEGDAAQQEAGAIARLKELGGSIKNMGAGAALQARLADLGFKVGENVSEIEAYGAIIDKLTPQQRAPGSGATSDFDAKMFKNSLPGLIRTPQGNALILETMEALNTFKRQRADIVAEAMALNEKPADVMKRLKELPDPFAAFKEARKTAPSMPATPAAPGASAAGQPRAVATPQDYQALKPGDQYVDPQGNIRTKR